MSPTVFKWKGYRFFFFSREETRPHVHVYCSDGEAKFWLEPVRLERSRGFSRRRKCDSSYPIRIYSEVRTGRNLASGRGV